MDKLAATVKPRHNFKPQRYGYMQRNANNPEPDTNDCSNNPTLKTKSDFEEKTKRRPSVTCKKRTVRTSLLQGGEGGRKTGGDEEARLANLAGKSEATTRLRDACSTRVDDGTLDALQPISKSDSIAHGTCFADYMKGRYAFRSTACLALVAKVG